MAKQSPINQSHWPPPISRCLVAPKVHSKTITTNLSTPLSPLSSSSPRCQLAALSSQRVLSSQQRAQQHYHQKQEQQLFGQAAGQQLEPPMAASQQQPQPQRLYPAELRIEGDLIVQVSFGPSIVVGPDGAYIGQRDSARAGKPCGRNRRRCL